MAEEFAQAVRRLPDEHNYCEGYFGGYMYAWRLVRHHMKAVREGFRVEALRGYLEDSLVVPTPILFEGEEDHEKGYEAGYRHACALLLDALKSGNEGYPQ